MNDEALSRLEASCPDAFAFEDKLFGPGRRGSGLLEKPDAEHGETHKHIGKKRPYFCHICLGERGKLRNVCVVKFAALSLTCELNKSRFKVLDVCLVEVLVLARKRKRADPKVLFGRLLLNARPNRIPFAY